MVRLTNLVMKTLGSLILLSRRESCADRCESIDGRLPIEMIPYIVHHWHCNDDITRSTGSLPYLGQIIVTIWKRWHQRALTPVEMVDLVFQKWLNSPACFVSIPTASAPPSCKNASWREMSSVDRTKRGISYRDDHDRGIDTLCQDSHSVGVEWLGNEGNWNKSLSVYAKYCGEKLESHLCHSSWTSRTIGHQLCPAQPDFQTQSRKFWMRCLWKGRSEWIPVKMFRKRQFCGPIGPLGRLDSTGLRAEDSDQ